MVNPDGPVRPFLAVTLAGGLLLAGCVGPLGGTEDAEERLDESRVQGASGAGPDGATDTRGAPQNRDTNNSSRLGVELSSLPDRATRDDPVSIEWRVEANRSDPQDRDANSTVERTRLHWGSKHVPEHALDQTRPYGNATAPYGPDRTPATFSDRIVPNATGRLFLRAQAVTQDDSGTTHRFWSSEAEIEVVSPETVDTYAIPLVWSWSKTDLSTVVVPPASGPLYDQELEPFPEGHGLLTDSPYVQATVDAVEAWDRTMEAHAARNPGADYLEDFSVDVQVLGEDASVGDVQSADVVVAYSQTMANVLGLAYNSGWMFGESGEVTHCSIVLSELTLFSLTSNDMYNVALHEFGHCLGFEHVQAPERDIMYQGSRPLSGDPDTRRWCVSSLDLAGLEAAYAWLEEGDGWQAPPERAEIVQDGFQVYPAVGQQESCPNGPMVEG